MTIPTTHIPTEIYFTKSSKSKPPANPNPIPKKCMTCNTVSQNIFAEIRRQKKSYYCCSFECFTIFRAKCRATLKGQI